MDISLPLGFAASGSHTDPNRVIFWKEEKHAQTYEIERRKKINAHMNRSAWLWIRSAANYAIDYNGSWRRDEKKNNEYEARGIQQYLIGRETQQTNRSPSISPFGQWRGKGQSSLPQPHWFSNWPLRWLLSKLRAAAYRWTEVQRRCLSSIIAHGI